MTFTEFNLDMLCSQLNHPDFKKSGVFSLIRLIIDRKKFRFKSEEISGEFVALFDQGVLVKDGLIVDGNDLTVSFKPIIYYALLHEAGLGTKFDLETPIEISTIAIDEFSNLFEQDGHFFGSIHLYQLKGFLFLCVAKSKKRDPVLDLDLRSIPNSDWYNYHNFYFENLDIWNHSYEVFWRIVKIYATELSDPATGTADLGWNILAKAITHALELQIDLSKPTQLGRNEIGNGKLQILSNITFTWLYQHNKLSEEDVLNLLSDSKTENLGILLFLNKLPDSDDVIYKIWKLLTNDEQIAFNKSASLLFAKILNENQNLTITTSEKLKLHFTNVLMTNDVNNIVSSIISLNELRNDQDFALAVFKESIICRPFDLKIFEAVLSYYHKSLNVNHFFTYLHAMAMEKRSNFPIEQLRSTCETLYKGHPNIYIAKLVTLLVDDWGYVRKIGGHLLFDLLHNNAFVKFPFDISTLSALEQYKLLVSITAFPLPFRELTQSLEMFLQSDSDIVLELCYCRFEKVAGDYGIKTIDFLKRNPAIKNESELLNRLHSIISHSNEIAAKKQIVKELSSEIAFPIEKRKFMDIYSQKNNQEFRDLRAKHNGISSLFKNIIVHRGGGVVSTDGRTSPFFTISSTYDIPISTFIDPVGHDEETHSFYTSNWSEDFEKCKEIILSSRNTWKV